MYPRTCFLLLSLALAAATRSSWTKVGPSDPNRILKLTVAVKHLPSSLAELDRAFWERADPYSPSFADHLSYAEVTELSRPHANTVQVVVHWLTGELHNNSSIAFSASQDFVFATVTIAQAERLLGTRYYEFHHTSPDKNITINRCGAVSLPPSVRSAIDFVAPTNHFPSPLGLKTTAPVVTSGVDKPALRTDPPSLRDLYKIGDTTGSNNPSNRQQVAGFLNNFFAPSDLDLFFSTYYPPAKGETAKVVGPNNAGNPTIEGSVDMQYIMSIGSGVDTTYWYTPGQRPYDMGENEPFLDWLTAVVALNDTQLPTVISVSYADEEFVIDLDFLARVEVEFQKLGLRGTTLLFGSGDDGVTGDKGTCPKGTFVPWWPASSPFVIAVGSTDAFNPLQGASFSGGGFSDVHAAQDYQKSAVAKYLSNTGLPPRKFYNTSGIGFPDVAAVGLNFWTYVGGLPTEVGGTSASTPVFAGIISLLNDARMKAGKRSLGYLNPTLYAHADIFLDITMGSNPGGGGCGYGGFPAAVGWDPVTGLGTPDFPKLLALALSLP